MSAEVDDDGTPSPKTPTAALKLAPACPAIPAKGILRSTSPAGQWQTKTRKKIKQKKVRFHSTKVYQFTVERGNVLEYSPSLSHDLTFRHSPEHLKLESEDSLVRAQLEGERLRKYIMDHVISCKKKRSPKNAEQDKRYEDPPILDELSVAAEDAEAEMPPAPAAAASKKKRKKKRTPVASISDADDLCISWLIDTGSPFDLIGCDELPPNAVKRKIKGQALYTANGEIVANEVVDIAILDLQETASPLLLDATPAVLSVGLRCMELGYSFHWPNKENPYFILPSGKRYTMRVDRNVPYLCRCEAPACVCTIGRRTAAPVEVKPPPVEQAEAQPAHASASSHGPGVASSSANDAVVEVVAPPPIPLLGGRVDRRREAESLEHQMTHQPKNKYCPACQRGKMQKAHARQVEGSELGKPEQFGDQTTADHLITRDELDKGSEGQETAVVVMDRFTGWRDCYPKASKSADDAYAALLDFQGPKDTVKYFYSDSSPELQKAATDLGWCHGTATPGRKESNGVAEAAVKSVIQGTRSILEKAGFKAAWWPMAVRHWCFATNTAIVEGNSSWQLRHGKGHFSGLRLPFGCLVDFKPSAVKQGKRGRQVPHPKFAPVAEPGVFMGYHILPGGRWRGDYLVATLHEFNVAIANPGRSGKHKIRIQRVKELYRNPLEAITFPLKEQYDREMRTIHGAKPDPVLEPVLVLDQDEEAQPVVAADTPQAESETAANGRTPEEQRVVNALSMQKAQDLPEAERERMITALVSDSGLIATQEAPIAQGGVRHAPDERYIVVPTGAITAEAPPPPKPIKPLHERYKVVPGGTIVDGRFIRAYKGSGRVPDIWPEIWVVMTDEQKKTARKEFEAALALGLDAGNVNPAAPARPCSRADYTVPTMRVRPHDPSHRDRIAAYQYPFNVCVARPVTKKEVGTSPKAWAALTMEWDKLRAQRCWDETKVREWRDVSADAKRLNKKAHVGRIFDICVEKGSELGENDPGRKFKGRVVFQGNNVWDENHEHALFAELSSAPATMESGKTADAYGLFPGHACEQADGESAYTQSVLKGEATWVRLPRERWPASWYRGGDTSKPLYADPVCRLILSLYGHPDAGGYWEKHCHQHPLAIGSTIAKEDWMSWYSHVVLKLLLAVHV